MVIGDFELIEPLGEGTAGLAYRARHQKTGQAVAVKLLHQDLSQAEEIQRRFVREVAIAQRLDHPNIVRHLDSGLHDDQIFFAMELVECGTLKEILLRRQTLPWQEAVESAIQICAGLDYAHRQGIVHRDLKPANLFLSDDGKVKIGDFGLARDLQSFRLTIDGQTVGTVRYMPPEQITGEAELTGAVDLYALGCMLYEMLVGHTPFGGNSILAIFEQHLNTVPTQPSALVPDCPPDLSALVMHLLAKKPEDRPASAAIVRAALVDILHGKPMRLEGRPDDEPEEDPAPSLDDGKPNLTSRLRVGAVSQPREDSNKRLLIIAGVLVVCTLGACLIYFMR